MQGRKEIGKDYGRDEERKMVGKEERGRMEKRRRERKEE
jgi:hypothetical protein